MTTEGNNPRMATRIARQFADVAQRFGGRLREEDGAREQGRRIACAAMALCGCRPGLSETAARWLLADGDQATREVLAEALEVAKQCGSRVANRDNRWPHLSAKEIAALPGPVACAELFLSETDKAQRAAQGFYVTPAPVARFIVSAAHRYLQTEFGLLDGLLDATTWRQAIDHGGFSRPRELRQEMLDTPLVRVLDPAVGSGAFLVAAIEIAHQAYRSRARRESWSEIVAHRLLPRLVGIELMPAAAVCAHIAVADVLQRTGYDFSLSARPRIYVGDTLAAVETQDRLFDEGAPPRQRELDFVRRDEPFTVVVGNPPFLAAALPGLRWVERLLKGRGPEGEATANYYEVEGRPLAEKKLWLHDDYVKFLRYAQWRIGRVGCGIVGMVTNHGYLDNATFRGMREKLLHDFPRITIVDLHGNPKKKEKPPAGMANENVFAIQQGAAVALMRRPIRRCTAETEYAEVWGSRQEKLQALGGEAPTGLKPTLLCPAAPHYFFVPHDDRLAAEYGGGWSLPEVMPVYTTAPVTARDGFVVALDAAELEQRMRDFRDLAISEDEIRSRYFRSTRSVRFAAGDTRSWKLSEARRRMAGDPRWREPIGSCLYRPFDRRSLYWSPTMIDWPRTEVMRHLEPSGNLALIARRQMPPAEPCTYFWITDRVALDGVIRSDNRGSESLFPLWLHDENGDAPARANFQDAFLHHARQRLGAKSLSPCDLLSMIYALFHAPSYRSRYAEYLRIEFPRVFVPGSAQLFFELVSAGQRLIALHTMREEPNRRRPEPTRLDDGTPPRVSPSFPRYEREVVWINPNSSFAPVPQRVWEFRAGGHQVCRKWLKDRKGRVLSDVDIACYRWIVAAIDETLEVVETIERAIASHGGWEQAFIV
jgi:hypothetical protein